MERLKRVFCYYFKENEPFRAVIQGAIYLVFLLIILLITAINGEGDDVPAIATIIYIFVTLVFTLFQNIAIYCTDYDAMVKNGSTRRTALISLGIEGLIIPMLYEALAIPFEFLERGLMIALFGPSAVTPKLFIIETWWIWMFIAVPLVWLLSLLASYLFKRFGQYAMVACYFVFFGGSTLLPMVHDKLLETSELYRSLLATLAMHIPVLATVLVVLFLGLVLLFHRLLARVNVQ